MPVVLFLQCLGVVLCMLLVFAESGCSIIRSGVRRSTFRWPHASGIEGSCGVGQVQNTLLHVDR